MTAQARAYLQSVMEACMRLQNMSDEELESIKDGLHRVDDDLWEGIDYVDEIRDSKKV